MGLNEKEKQAVQLRAYVKAAYNMTLDMLTQQLEIQQFKCGEFKRSLEAEQAVLRGYREAFAEKKAALK